MSKQKMEMATEARTISAPVRFMEEKQEANEYLTTLADYRKHVRNTDRQASPLKFLTQQASFCKRVFLLLDESGGITNLKIKANDNGGWVTVATSKATFSKGYFEVVAELEKAELNGVAVCKADIRTTAKGDYVKIVSLNGIIGV